MNYSQLDSALKLEAIIETAIDGIITINVNGVVESINTAAVDMFGYEKSELLGKNISILMPQPAREKHDSYIDRYIKSRIPHIIGIGREVQALKKDGTVFPVRLAINEIQLKGRIIFAGILHDLSEVNKVKEELIDINNKLEKLVETRTLELEEVVNKLLSTNTKLEKNEHDLKKALDKEIELNELKSRFVSMASHEFRTPLSTILSSASLIARYKKTDEDEKRVKHINRIKSAVTNLTGILNDFVALSKLEEGRIDLALSNVSLSEMCTEILEEIQGLLEEGQHIDYDHQGEDNILTDRRIVKNIFFNLLSNAIKYSKPNTLICCNTTVRDQEVIIVVKDEGIGIPKEDQKHLFNRFFRASNVETIQGTGLGLNIVKEYVDLLGGKITFESAEGIGSSFTVCLKRIK